MRRVFNIAVAVALVHALDDAFVHRGRGLGLGQHALAAAIALAAGLAAATALLPVPDAVVIAVATIVYFGVLGALGRIPWELRDAARR